MGVTYFTFFLFFKYYVFEIRPMNLMANVTACLSTSSYQNIVLDIGLTLLGYAHDKWQI